MMKNIKIIITSPINKSKAFEASGNHHNTEQFEQWVIVYFGFGNGYT
jgi:hypothetical protein